jgi:hypothetical protein
MRPVTRVAVLLAIAFLVGVACCDVHAGDSFFFKDWDTTDTVLQSTATVLTIMDWMQTLQIADNPHKYREKNFILGPNPSRSAVNNYFPIYIGAQLLMAAVLPKPYRNVFQVGVVIGQGITVTKNYQVGLRFRF